MSRQSGISADLEYDIIKLIKEIVGDGQWEASITGGAGYAIRLVDQSERESIDYSVYILTNYESLYNVMVAAGAGDTILIPSGTFSDFGDTSDGSTSDIAFVGDSRIQTIQSGDAYFAAGGGSLENLSFIGSFNSAGDIRGVLLYGAGTLHVDSVHIEETQTGSGDVNGVSAEDADAIIHVWNSYIKANASGAGAGYAAYSDGEVHFHNCHLVYNDAIENPAGDGTVYLHGCSTETI